MDHVLECVNNLSALFFRDPERVVNESRVFVDVIETILAESTMERAKSLVSFGSTGGELVKEMVNMVRAQMWNSERWVKGGKKPCRRV